MISGIAEVPQLNKIDGIGIHKGQCVIYSLLSHRYGMLCRMFIILMLFNINQYSPYTIYIDNKRYYASNQMEKFERELNNERLSKKEVSLGGKKQQLYYHEDLLVSYCCNCYTILSKINRPNSN